MLGITDDVIRVALEGVGYGVLGTVGWVCVRWGVNATKDARESARRDSLAAQDTSAAAIAVWQKLAEAAADRLAEREEAWAEERDRLQRQIADLITGSDR